MAILQEQEEKKNAPEKNCGRNLLQNQRQPQIRSLKKEKFKLKIANHQKRERLIQRISQWIKRKRLSLLHPDPQIPEENCEFDVCEKNVINK